MEDTARKNDGVIDLRARRAQAALERIGKEAGAFKRTREAWRDYGLQLLEMRREMERSKKGFSKILFGRWVKENGLDASPAAVYSTRSNAMWLAEHWEEVAKVYHEQNITNNDCSPSGIRLSCRRAGFAWALGTKEKRQRKKLGWTAAVEKILGKMPAGFSCDYIQHSPNIRKEIEKEFGRPIPRYVTLDSDEARELAAAVQRCADRKHPGDLADEKDTLSETAQQKFDRLVARQLALMREQFQVQLKAEVRKQVDATLESERKFYYTRMEEARIEKERYVNLSKKVEKVMSHEDFRLILGCLHPDRVPEGQQGKYNKAFDIFKRLERQIDWEKAGR